MIVTDLDGTLLKNDKTISYRTIETLKKCQMNGIKIVFATARSTQVAAKALGFFTPDAFIGYGGSLVTAGAEVIGRCDIPSDISSKIIRDCLSEPEITYIHAINENDALTNCIAGAEDAEMSHYRRVDFSEVPEQSYLKISMNANSQAAVEKIAAMYPMCDMLRYTGEDLYRFANRNAVKWNAVVIAAEHYGIDTNLIVVFGDDINDTEMILNCGVGVAVSNAVDEVKAAADYICGSNDEDGVAEWIEKNILS